ncbi:DinB family protein [Tenacibaculum sp. ZS6-P6]
MKLFTLGLIFFMMSTQTQAQNLPYYEIPKASDSYTAGSVASRMIDGLGFRYYWATEGLTEKDLKFKPSDEARNLFDTVDHILVLSIMTLSAVEEVEMSFPEEGTLTFSEMRKLTLENFKKASEILKSSNDLSKYIMKIPRRNNNVVEYPFWNQLNGPIADAIWHCGQIVTFRRTSGNPLPKGPSFLTGKVRR